MNPLALAILIFCVSDAFAEPDRASDPSSTQSVPEPERNPRSGFNSSEFRFPDKRPFIALTARDIAQARQRVVQYHWASAILRDTLTQADSLIATVWPVDTRRSDPKVLDRAEQLLAVARAYALNENPAYAKWVRDGLLLYADLYPTLSLKNYRSKAQASSLAEAEWLAALAQAYDLVADGGQLTGDQKRHIEEDLLRASVPCFKIDDYQNDPRIADLHFRCYNFQAWHLAAIGLVGLAVRDPTLIDYAINSRYGFKHLVAHDIRDDGMFWERSQAYHRFVLEALLPFTEGMAHCGVDLYNLAVPSDNHTVEGVHYPTDTSQAPKSLRLMFEAPLYTAFPDLSCLAMGDGPNQIEIGWIEQVAWTRCRSPVAACLLRGLDETGGRVGFLHYYRYSYRVENVSLNDRPIHWGCVDATFRLGIHSVLADDGGQSQTSRFLLNDTDVTNFTLTWTMTRLRDFGGQDRAWLVFGAARHGDPCNKVGLVDLLPELNRPSKFELHVTGEKVILLRDDKEIPVRINRSEGFRTVQALTADLPLVKDRAAAVAKVFTDGKFANSGVYQSGCSLLPSTGLVVLRQSQGDFRRQSDSAAVALTYGPYGGGHCHPDKLGIAFYTQGRLWVPVFPSMPYETAWKKEWTSHTISQNTLVIDGVSQQPVGQQDRMWPVDSADKRVIGKLERFDAAAKLAVASSDSAYDGFRMARSVKLQGDCLIDMLEATPKVVAQGASDHQFDYVLHMDGLLDACSVQLEPHTGPLGKGCGYQHVQQRQAATIQDVTAVTFTSPTQQRLRVWIVPRDAQPLKLILADGLTSSPVITMPMLILRTIGQSAKDLVILEPLRGDNSITSLKLQKNQIILVRGKNEEPVPLK